MPIKLTTQLLPDLGHATSKLAQGAAEVLWQAEQQEQPGHFLEASLPAFRGAAGGDDLLLLSAESGHWSVVAKAGTRTAVPLELLGEVADRELLVVQGNWVATPLKSEGRRLEILALYTATERVSAAREAVETLAPILAAALAGVRSRAAQRRRMQRLEAILEIAQKWYQTHEMEPLLKGMAEAATRLMVADRASIFLWDRATKTLVGRPALGVENELRVPEDAGVVGRVLQAGQPRRVSSSEAAREIDRNVDLKLKYQTKNLVAVPLRSPGGELVGVFEVLNKREGDFTDEDEGALVELAAHAAIALENTQEREELVKARDRLRERAAEKTRIIGKSLPIEALRSTVRRVADTELAVLILGENGSGKEVVAQSIHYLSQRRDEPFIAVNCGAITETLLESELFGHERGAFTDAHETRQGKFELASGGTLFLDEIGDMSPSGQSKLLRVLEDKVVVRVGGSKPIRTDTRVIAATNRNLLEMVRSKKFREDLYFRLNIVTINLPPLRDRGDDILLLAEHFMVEFCRKAHRQPLQLSAAVKKRMSQHAWPGNVRELRNLMERLAYMTQGETVDVDDLAFILSPNGETTAPPLEGPLSDATDQFQIEYIQKAIKRAHGNMSDAAERLGLHRSNLYRKMRQLGMQGAEE